MVYEEWVIVMEDIKIDFKKVQLMKWITKKANGRLIDTPKNYLWLPKIRPMKSGKIRFIHDAKSVKEITTTDCDCEIYVSSKDLKFYDFFDLFEPTGREYKIYNVGEWCVVEVSVKKGESNKQI